jgi:ABC-type Na+ efflux pump permease subunit
MVQKELLYLSRDPDVIIYTALVPLLLYPLMFIGANDFAMWLAGNLEKQPSRVAMQAVTDWRADVARAAIKEVPNSTLIESPNAVADLRAGKLDAYVEFPDAEHVYVDIAKSSFVDKTSLKLVAEMQYAFNKERRKRNKQSANSDIFNVRTIEVAPSESRGTFVPISKLGGLPLSVIILSALLWIHVAIGMGPPATVMFAEHREKKTVETMFIEPVSRAALVFAKFCTVWLLGILAALTYAVGFVLTATAILTSLVQKMNTSNALAAFLSVINFRGVSWESWLLLVIAFVLNTALCAIIFLAFAARASTFKQAQALITIPMIFVITLPLLAFLPGFELSWLTAACPALNMFLVLKRGEPNLILTLASIAWDVVVFAMFFVITRVGLQSETSLT